MQAEPVEQQPNRANIDPEKTFEAVLMPVTGQCALPGVVVFRNNLVDFDENMAKNGPVECKKFDNGAKLFVVNTPQYTMAALEYRVPKIKFKKRNDGAAAALRYIVGLVGFALLAVFGFREAAIATLLFTAMLIIDIEKSSRKTEKIKKLKAKRQEEAYKQYAAIINDEYAKLILGRFIKID